MKSQILRYACVALSVLLCSEAWASKEIEIAGVVLAPDGKPISDVRVSIYRQGVVAKEVRTSQAGAYQIVLPEGGSLDLVRYEHPVWLPRVIEGPLPGTVNSRINVTLLEANTAPSPYEALMELHAIQFLKLLSIKQDLPKNFQIPAQLAFAAACVQRGTDVEMGTSGAGKTGMWSLEDPFFEFEGAASRP